jgi:polysaccharide biosynthesis/export protein
MKSYSVTRSWSLSKVLIYFFFGLVIAACASEPKASKQQMAFGPNDTAGPVISSFQDYTFIPGDIIDIIYQVIPIKIDRYILSIQDVLEIRIPLKPELNSEQTIRPDGMITLPYVGDVYVIGLTTEEATNKIRGAYKNILRHPDIYMYVKDFGAAVKELKKVITTAPRGQSKLLTVRADGYVSFPLIGDVYVVGKTIPQVSSEVNSAYQRLYSELQVDVMLEKTAGSFVYVLGEVGRPGAYEIKRPCTVIEALALAGGPTITARLDYVALARREGTTIDYRTIDVKAIMNGDPNTKVNLLKADDVVYVPRRPLATAAQIAREISDVTFFKGYSVSLDPLGAP